MAGYPFSGKSHIAEILAKLHPDINIINPKLLRPAEYEKMSEDDKRDCNLAAWEVSLEELEEAIVTRSDKITIYDTCCASFYKMEPYFVLAKQQRHKIIYVFVDSSLELCEKRAGSNWLPKEVIEKYDVNFGVSIEGLAKLADHTIVVKNQEDEPDVTKIMRLIE